MNKSKIIKVVGGNKIWVHLRKFDNKKFGSYDEVKWLENLEYVVEGEISQISKSGVSAKIFFPLVKKSVIFHNYDIECFTFTAIPFEAEYKFKVVDQAYFNSLDGDSQNILKFMFTLCL